LVKSRDNGGGKDKKLLVIEDDAAQRMAIRETGWRENGGGRWKQQAPPRLAALRNQDVGCLILDLMLPDMSASN